MRRVLVVDDEENIRLVLKTLLKRHGYDVEVADSGESALVLVDSFGPDVILTDTRGTTFPPVQTAASLLMKLVSPFCLNYSVIMESTIRQSLRV